MKWFVFILCVMTTYGVFTFSQAAQENETQQSIASGIVRLHVVANSDVEADQNLKLKVRDQVVSYLQKRLKHVTNVNEARALMNQERALLSDLAQQVMRAEGYDYRAEVSLGSCYFLIKKYGDLTFPAGDYQALMIRIGQGEGKNWWCVMYPSLCFVDSTYQVVPEESKEKLKETMTKEDYEMLLGGESEVSFGFKLLDWVDKLF